MKRILVLVPFLLAATCDPPQPVPVPPVVDASTPDATPTPDASQPDAGPELSRCERAAGQAISLGCRPPAIGSWGGWAEVCEHNEERGIDMQADKIQRAETCEQIDQLRRGDVR